MTLPAIMTGAARVTQPPSRLPAELDPRGPGRSRPTRGSTGTRARPGIARWLRWTAGGSALAVALVLVGGFAAYAYYSGRLGHVSIRLPGQAAPADSDGPAQDFLIVGSDTRDFAGGQAFQASPGSAENVTGQRSDTVMLVHLPAGNTKATLVSFPRDSYVQIPAHPDEKGRPQAPYLAKLNEAFSVGGPALLVQLVENLSGLRIDHYVAVDFAGFKHMVDALALAWSISTTLCSTPWIDRVAPSVVIGMVSKETCPASRCRSRVARVRRLPTPRPWSTVTFPVAAVRKALSFSGLARVPALVTFVSIWARKYCWSRIRSRSPLGRPLRSRTKASASSPVTFWWTPLVSMSPLSGSCRVVLTHRVTPPSASTMCLNPAKSTAT